MLAQILLTLSEKIGLNSVRANQNFATSGGRSLKWVTLVHALVMGARTRTRLGRDYRVHPTLVLGRTLSPVGQADF